jgi:Thymidylate kinase
VCGKLRASPAVFTAHVANLIRPNASVLPPLLHIAAAASKSRTHRLLAATPRTLLQSIPCNGGLGGDAGAVRSVRAAGIGRSASIGAMAVAADSESNGARGAFILFEGVDRCGKSTQAKRLVEHLTARGVRENASPHASSGNLCNRCVCSRHWHPLYTTLNATDVPACRARWRRSCGTSRTAPPPSAR